MSKVIEKKKVTEVVFNLVSTLTVIGSDVDLTTMFSDKNLSTDFKQHIAFARGGLFKDSVAKFVKGIFTNVILKRKEYLDAYQLVQEQELLRIDKSLPKRYGKKQLLLDIEEQKSPMTERQRMMLKINDLKNIYARLNRKGISVCLGDGKITDTDCRDIIASINQLETKLKKSL